MRGGGGGGGGGGSFLAVHLEINLDANIISVPVTFALHYFTDGIQRLTLQPNSAFL